MPSSVRIARHGLRQPAVGSSMWWRAVLIMAVFLGLLAGPALLIRATMRDAEPPLGLSRPIGAFGTLLVNELDRSPTTHVRFIGHEWRPDDQLVILFFELRSWPYVAPPTIGYLVSRCSPIEALDATGMGGGLVLGGDVSRDPELEFLRDVEAQPSCP
jgi:hypothetical protein